MKTCRVCNEAKPLECFGVNNKQPDKKDYKCKPCNRKLRRDYFRSFDGVITDIYANEKKSARERNISPPQYTKQELKTYLTNSVIFHKLYDVWVASNYKTNLKPSIDRVDDMLGYSFDNIEVVTWEENYKRCGENVLLGTNCKTINKTFYIYEHGIVTEFTSLRGVADYTGLYYDELWEMVTTGNEVHGITLYEEVEND